MTFLLLILLIVFPMGIGFLIIKRNETKEQERYFFANEYRSSFVNFANKYMKTYDRWSGSGSFNDETYTWLTMNVSRIQREIGSFGIVTYTPPYKTYMIKNYQAIVNTIPKFRDSTIQSMDITLADDCLLRYIGYLKEKNQWARVKLKNPIHWFRTGTQEIIGTPILLLNWFGILGNRTLKIIKTSILYQIATGIVGLVGFISAIVTIILGYNQTVEFIQRLFDK